MANLKIVVALIEHIGDIIACEPVVRYLKVKYPDSTITWVVSKKFRLLVDANPFVDETIAVDCLTDWIKLSNHNAFDLVVDLHVNYRVCECCRIPLIKKHGHPFVSVYEWFDYGALLEAFSIGAGLPPLSAQPRLYVPETAKESIRALDLPREYCVIHRCSNSLIKDWDDKKWLELVTHIKEEHGLPVVEIGAGTSAVTPLEGNVVNLINKTTLFETAAVIAGARFFLGIDSGPAHMANAQEIPGIILLGRHASFRKYNPYTGYYASNDAGVKIVRNLVGNVVDISVNEVTRAVEYVNNAAVSGNARRPGERIGPISTVTPHERGVVRLSGIFDEAWYRLHTPDLDGSDIDPVDHFLFTRGERSTATLPGFDSAWYLKTYPEVAATGVPPLLHYLTNSGYARRYWQIFNTSANWTIEGEADQVTTPSTKRRTLAGPQEGGADTTLSDALDLPTAPSKLESSKLAAKTFPRTFAFYLPQFHPMPENNWAHGMGFSEWHNVTKASPLYAGHYQPKIPGELGYYDLRSAEVMKEQIDLAVQHGIDGFCFYYYYFAGQKILYKPIENYIKSDAKAPFLFLWANENWSKRWDGGDQELIVAQEHSDFDDLMFIRELFETFRDPRYVKINGKPVLMVYKTHLFPNILETTDRWREEALANGFPGLYLIKAEDWIRDEEHPRVYGFDASYEIPSNLTPDNVEVDKEDAPKMVEGFTGRLIDYQKFASFHAGSRYLEKRRFRTVMLPWDNTARYGLRAIVHTNNHGDGYRNWLSQALLDSYRRSCPEERIVFLHSWNEWCEGTYLEPDGKYGRYFLNQTKAVVQNIRTAITAMESNVEPEIWLALDNAQRFKDEGAFRALKAARRESEYLWQLLHNREKLSGLSRVPAGLSKKEIRILIAFFKLKRFAVLPFKKQRRHQARKIANLRQILSQITSS